MFFSVPLVEFRVCVMLSYFEEVAWEHVQEQIQRGFAGYGVHFILKDAGEAPILRGVGRHLDFSGNAVRDVTDELD